MNHYQRVTLDDLAKLFGVSKMTVSRALNKKRFKRQDAAKLAEKIRQKAFELGYRRNYGPILMNQQTYQTIGILRSTVEYRNHLPLTRLRGIEERIFQLGLRLQIIRISDERFQDPSYMQHILSNLMVDGLLIDLIVDIPQTFTEILQRYRIPAIWMNVKQPLNAVYFDDYQAAWDATLYLQKLGHKRIGMWCQYHPESKIHYSSIDRREGYLQAMQQANLPPCFYQPSRHLDYYEYYPYFVDLLSKERLSALILLGGTELVAVLAAANELRIRIPQDLSLIVFENYLLFTLPIQATTMYLPEDNLGHTAVDLLMWRIEHEGEDVPSVSLHVPLKVGFTTMPYKR